MCGNVERMIKFDQHLIPAGSTDMKRGSSTGSRSIGSTLWKRGL